MIPANPTQSFSPPKARWNVTRPRISSLFSLRARLSLIVLLAVVPAALFLLYDATLLRSRAEKEAEEELLRLNQFVAASYGQRVDEAHRLLAAIAQFPEVREGDAEACSARLAQLVELYRPYILGFGVSNLDGEMFCTSAPVTTVPQIADRLWFRQAVQSGEFTIGEFTMRRPGGQPILGLSYPILDQNGQVVRVLAISLLLSSLQEQADAMPLPPDTVLTISDNNGVILARIPDGEQLVGLLRADIEMQQMRSQGEGVFQAVGVDGIKRLFAFTPIAGPAGSQVWLSLGRTPDVLYANVREIIIRDVIGIATVLLVILIALWFGSNRLILQPVQQLVSISNRLAKGDLDTRTGLQSDRSELGSLAVAFDHMAESLQQRIAGQQQAEAELLERERHLHLALQAARMVAWTWDLAENRVHATDHFIDICGTTPVQHAEQGFALIHSEDRERHQQALAHALANQEPYHSEFRIIRPDNGAIVWLNEHAVPVVDDTGKMQKLAGVFIDVTERKQAEAQLAYHAHLLKNLDDAVLATDTSHRITAWNRGAEKMYGWKTEEVLGRQASEVMRSSMSAEQRAAIVNQLAEAGHYRIETIVHHRNGTPIYTDAINTALYDKNGAVMGYVAINRDITERKQVEQELTRLNETLEQRVRERTEELEQTNRELDQFAHIAVHDLKAPLRAVSLLAQWIREDSADNLSEKSKDHLIKLQQRAHRMDKMLNDLLAYSRAGSVRFQIERVSTRELIHNIIELLPLPPDFVVTITEPIPVLVTERVPLETALRNLIDNAVKHHHQPEIGQVTIAAEIEGNWAKFQVQDNGPGIEARFHERIFGIFQTLRPRDQVEGSGIGLALVKRLVESRGGTIGLQSEPGTGTLFFFTWPVSTTT